MISTEQKIKRICVFCASSVSKDEKITEKTIQLGNEMLQRQISLVYGGGTRGLMGIVASTVHSGGGKVLGIIPVPLIQKEAEGSKIGEQIHVDSMHERKFKMYQHSDAFIALPGGFGTLDELMEVLTWAQLGIHSKPIGILNIGGYFDGLLQFFKNGVETGLISAVNMNLMIVDSDPSSLIDKLEQYVPPKPFLNWNLSEKLVSE